MSGEPRKGTGEGQRKERRALDEAREIDLILEEANHWIVELGKKAKECFRDGGKTQLSNLEQAALHATTFAEIEAFIKRQAGKERREGQAWRILADRLLWLVEHLRAEAEKRLAGNERDAGARLRRLLELRVPERLVGTAFRWLHSEYLYRVASGTGGGGGGR